MAGSYPTTPYFNTTAIEQEQPILVSKARSGRQKRRRHSGHIWRLTGAYINKTPDEFLPIFAFLCDREGGLNNFTFIPVEHATPRGVASGSPLVDGVSQTGKVINLKGASLSVTDWFKAGDIVAFAGHTKVYMCTANVNSDGAGNVALPIVPSLIESPLDNAIVTVNNVPFTMILSENNVKASKKPPVLYSGIVEMEEDI